MPPKPDTNKPKQPTKPDTKKDNKQEDRKNALKAMDLNDGWLYHSKK
jgi:hypothetical protein